MNHEQEKQIQLKSALRETVDKANRMGGDPFREYRRAGSLPPKFEYGMNCALDRLSEDQGMQVAQWAYEELLAMGTASMWFAPTLFDVAHLPVLFGVPSGDYLEIVRRAAEKHNRLPIREARDITDKPTFLRQLDHESQHNYLLRLAAITTGITGAGEQLMGKHAGKERQLIETMGLVIEALGEQTEFTGQAADQVYMYGAAIKRGILYRQPDVPITDFLTGLSEKFENNVLELIVCSDQPVIDMINTHITDTYFSPKSTAQHIDAMYRWRQLAGSAERWQELWDEIRRTEIHDQVFDLEKLLTAPGEEDYLKGAIRMRIIIPEQVVLTFLRASGCSGGLIESIREVDRGAALFLAQNLARDQYNPGLTAWYKGETNILPISGLKDFRGN